jgi:hypothetical protein
MSRLPTSLHSPWLPSAKIYETDRFPRHMDRKTVHMDRNTVGMDREEIHMNRRAIHITRKTNRAATDMDCAIIHMDRASVPKGKCGFCRIPPNFECRIPYYIFDEQAKYGFLEVVR